MDFFRNRDVVGGHRPPLQLRITRRRRLQPAPTAVTHYRLPLHRRATGPFRAATSIRCSFPAWQAAKSILEIFKPEFVGVQALPEPVIISLKDINIHGGKFFVDLLHLLE